MNMTICPKPNMAPKYLVIGKNNGFKGLQPTIWKSNYPAAVYISNWKNDWAEGVSFSPIKDKAAWNAGPRTLPSIWNSIDIDMWKVLSSVNVALAT